MKDNQLDFYASLQSLLRYHDEIGLGPVTLNDDIRNFLSVRPPVPVSIGPGSEIVASRVDPQCNRTPEPVEQRAKATLLYTLADIEQEVTSCTACDLHKRRIYPVAGRGEKPVRLMIVGDWLAIAGAGSAIENQLFGVQQDQMLFRMLAAMKVPIDEVFITNVIKCGLPEKQQPLALHVKTCVAYLKRQILVLRPQYICTMGMVAAKAVLDRSLALSRLRGKLHDYQLGTDDKIPVLATYHPSYLLQNPEMKQATWTDLKFLAQKMGLLSGN
ncbi:MAG: uracil-DNA glycosylase family 4 [Desulforhopalus sp.]